MMFVRDYKLYPAPPFTPHDEDDAPAATVEYNLVVGGESLEISTHWEFTDTPLPMQLPCGFHHTLVPDETKWKNIGWDTVKRKKRKKK